MFKKRKYFLLLISFIFIFQINAEIISLTIGAGAAGALGFFLGDIGGLFSYAKCKFYECCRDPWLNKDIALKLELDMSERLYGQHIAQKTVINAIRAHITKENPNKALVLSFHGWSGSGKNYLTKMIAKAIYKKEMRSEFVHFFISDLHFPNPAEIQKYKDQLPKWIQGNLTKCERSLFIFDEIDKLPIQLIDTIVPFVDFYDQINGVDSRKSIFIFMSNVGANMINQRTLEYYSRGQIREEITLKELEELIQLSAFNEGIGGLKSSRIISKHLVDYFVPFLPMERKHVMLCFKDYLRSRNFNNYTPEQLERLVDSLQYFPKNTPIFSTSGCKQVEKKADFLLADIIRESHLHQLDDEL